MEVRNHEIFIHLRVFTPKQPKNWHNSTAWSRKYFIKSEGQSQRLTNIFLNLSYICLMLYSSKLVHK